MSRNLEVLLTLGLLCASSAHADEKSLNVAAASSLQDVLQEIGDAMPRDLIPGVELRYTFGATSTLVRQIDADAPVDVLVSADEANMDKLEKSGKIDAKSRVVVTANEIVLIVKPSAAKDLVTKPEDLLKPEVKRIALCDEAVPIGHYGNELLDKLGLQGKLAQKFVRPENVRATLKAVETDSADAGFVYVTDVAKTSKVRIVYQAGAKEGLGIQYPAAVIKKAKAAEAAGRYVQFLKSSAAQKIFHDYGFATAPAS